MSTTALVTDSSNSRSVRASTRARWMARSAARALLPQRGIAQGTSAGLCSRVTAFVSPMAACLITGLGSVDIACGGRVASKRFRYKARAAANGHPLGKEPHLATAAVAGPFGRNPEGSGAPLRPQLQMKAPCLAESQAASPRLALEAHWPERDPRRQCQQTLASLTRVFPGRSAPVPV